MIGPVDERATYEIDELVRALQDIGVLTRDNLRERSGAAAWPDHDFDEVLKEGVRQGRIKALGDDLFEA
jgi:hypothetical protein